MNRLFGLIGFPLGHSFSKKYFTDKFAKENIKECLYEKFEIESITQLPTLIKNNPGLEGLNVTIPHKQNVIPFLNKKDKSAEKVGAVNVLKISKEGEITGYNSDYYGFKTSLEKWLPKYSQFRALVLGSGGASKAVIATLDDMKIPFLLVSRQEKDKAITYEEITEEILQSHHLLINTTPLGMSPETETFPPISYNLLTEKHYLYDLVYNPEETAFMLKGKAAGAKVKNGLEMLILQAEKSWEIWNSTDL
jgi:shikimate dehydrogenase